MRSAQAKVLFFCGAIFMHFVAAAQKKDSVAYLKTSPLINGYPLVGKGTAKHEVIEPGRGLDINSDKQEVFSLSSGTVSACFSTDSSFILMIKTEDTFYVYNGLKELSVKKGDPVSKNMRIGTLSIDPELSAYTLNLQIWIASNKKTRQLDPGKIIEYKDKTDKG